MSAHRLIWTAMSRWICCSSHWPWVTSYPQHQQAVYPSGSSPQHLTPKTPAQSFSRWDTLAIVKTLPLSKQPLHELKSLPNILVSSETGCSHTNLTYTDTSNFHVDMLTENTVVGVTGFLVIFLIAWLPIPMYHLCDGCLTRIFPPFIHG